MENNVSKKHLQATILVRCLGILKIFAYFEPRVLNDCTKMVSRLRMNMLGAFNYHVDRRRWVDGQSNVYVYEANDVFFTSTRGQ